MRQISWITIAATLALLVGGCGQGGGDTTSETSPSPAPVAASPTTATPGAAQPSPGTSPGAETRTAALPRDLDLIPSTDPDQRVQSIQGNRSDPFSVVPTTPSVEITRTTPPGGTSGATSGGTGAAAGRTTGGAGAGGQTGRQAGRGGSGGQSRPGSLAPIPNLVPGSRSAPRVAARPVPPPPPQPELARAVQVFGVVQIGGVPYAIVSAPNEPTSRYVREGQRLSNGQVAVRRIDVNGPEPVVVFEQYGVEVVTAVGGGGAPASTPASPAASLPTGNAGQPG